MALKSVYDSIEFESRKPLKKYQKQLTKINKLKDQYRQMSDQELKDAAQPYKEHFDIGNKHHVYHVYAIAREVTYRLLGKFQYDVQVIGALAALNRNMIQMSTGSGKTITLILPAVAFGLTHKGVNILTVNDYLSKRDWEETKPVYDWFGLSNAYTSNDDPEPVQREAFSSDITYSTNSTLGFAYLNSALASDVGQDIKIITRPLHAAIIDEADEILMDDARNPLIIASAVDLAGQLSTIEYKGRVYSVQKIVDALATLSHVKHDKEDPSQQAYIDDETWEEIMTKLGFDSDIFEDPKIIHIIHSAVSAIFSYKLYTDYIVQPKPDPDSGSRVVLIDKATGRLSKGRTLSDNMHAFLEMKEHVFSGQSNESTIQVTYQTLFNLFETIAGVTGTLGTSFAEFVEIYQTGVVIVPDRLPNQLIQQTHLYTNKARMYDDLVRMTKIYMSSHRPVLIGAAADIEVELISNLFMKHNIEHKTLISTDTNEDAVVADAGKPGSVVITTDIMGRGTDIHVEDVEMDRGLVVLQVGARPNSRVERQFAGRAARQGQPGLYHRLLSLTELTEIGVPQSKIDIFMDIYRANRQLAEYYNGDLLLNGRNSQYKEMVDIIDDSLRGTESAYSASRVDDFKTYGITDLIQTSLLSELDIYRDVLRESLRSEDDTQLRQLVAKLRLPEALRKNKKALANSMHELDTMSKPQLEQAVFAYTQHIISVVIPSLREYSDSAINTVKLSQQVRYEVPPATMMLKLTQQFLNSHADDFVLGDNYLTSA